MSKLSLNVVREGFRDGVEARVATVGHPLALGPLALAGGRVGARTRLEGGAGHGGHGRRPREEEEDPIHLRIWVITNSMAGKKVPLPSMRQFSFCCPFALPSSSSQIPMKT